MLMRILKTILKVNENFRYPTDYNEAKVWFENFLMKDSRIWRLCRCQENNCY